MNEEFSEDEKAGFYKAIYSRRDVRSHFTTEPINNKILTKILDAAHHAPSVGFSQPWNFILIKDSNTKKKIKESFEKFRFNNCLWQKTNGILIPICPKGEIGLSALGN